MRATALLPLPATIIRKEGLIMEFANTVVTLITNIIGCAMFVAFLVGLIYAIRFMLQVKQEDKEDYERKKEREELEYKGAQLRYQKLLEDRR